MPRRKKKPIQDEVKWYAMFGFRRDNDSKVGYFKSPASIVDDIKEATFFPTQNVLSVQGFGTPKQWLQFINDDNDLNQGFQFHLVKKPTQLKP